MELEQLTETPPHMGPMGQQVDPFFLAIKNKLTHFKLTHFVKSGPFYENRDQKKKLTHLKKKLTHFKLTHLKTEKRSTGPEPVPGRRQGKGVIRVFSI